MTARQANVLTAVGLAGLLATVAFTAPRWAALLRSPATSVETDEVAAEETPRPAPEEGSAGRRISVRLYFEAPDRDGLLPEEREIAFSPDLAGQLRTVVEELAKGSTTGLLATLPPGTRVLEVFVQARGVAHVDLSAEAGAGLPGGSRAELLHGLLDRQHDRDELPVGEPGPDPRRRPIPDLARRPRGPLAAVAARHDPRRAPGAVGGGVAAGQRRGEAVSVTLAVVLAAALTAPGQGPRGGGAIAEAERLAREAMGLAAADPPAAVQKARRALALTAEFVPTDFVTAGRKGEVVEDEFQAARDGYRRHRAGLHEAVGTALARQANPLAASRYQRRAFVLDPTPERGLALARSLVALGRGREALDTVQRAIGGLARLEPEAAQVIAQAADAAGLPSAQAEVDRGRLVATLGKAVELREGPFELPPGVRLSTSPTFRLDDAAVTVIYAAEASCRSCSADLEALARQVSKETRVLALPPGDDEDQALRQVLALYRRPWPLLLGRDLESRMQLKPRTLLAVARGGWTTFVLKAPFGPELGQALAALQRVDVPETVPRPSWNRRPVDRTPIPAPPTLLPEGLAPGEDEPSRPSSRPRSRPTGRAGRPRRRRPSTRSRPAATAGSCPPRGVSTARCASPAPGSGTPPGGSCSAPATAASRRRSTSCSRRWAARHPEERRSRRATRDPPGPRRGFPGTDSDDSRARLDRALLVG